MNYMIIFLYFLTLSHQINYIISSEYPFQNMYSVGPGYKLCIVISAEHNLHISTYGDDMSDIVTSYLQYMEVCTHSLHMNGIYYFELIIVNINNTNCKTGINEYWSYHISWLIIWGIISLIIFYVLLLIMLIIICTFPIYIFRIMSKKKINHDESTYIDIS